MSLCKNHCVRRFMELMPPEELKQIALLDNYSPLFALRGDEPKGYAKNRLYASDLVKITPFCR